MGIGDFWLQANNKKALDEFKGEIKREDLSSKFDALFNIWDKDKSGKLEAGEVSSIFNQLSESEKKENQEFLGELFVKVSKSNANDLAKRFFKIAEDNKSNKSMQEFQKFLDEEINADNILDLLDAYDNPDVKKQDSSLIDTVVSEKLLSGDKKTQKKVLLTILDKVCEAARRNGVAEEDISKARKDFEDSLKEEYGTLSSMFRMANPLKMERAIDFLRGAILIKQNEVEDVDSKDAMLTVTEQFYNENETAYDEFNIERSATAKFGDWICGLFGCKTIDEMKSKLNMNVEGVNELLTALVNEDEEGFKIAYIKLFGIEFDPQKIAAAQALSEKLAAIQILSSNMQIFEEIKNSSDLEKTIKEKLGYPDKVVDEIIKNYPAETKAESLKLFVEESFNNAKDIVLELSDGKTLEQLSNDVELATKSAYGDNDVSKEITQFNQNMVMTEAIADSAFEIVGTIALTMIPVIGQLGTAAIAARTAKMGSNMVKVTQMLRKTSVAMYKANKFQQGTKYTSKIKNYGTRVAATMGNTAVATAGVNIYTEKDVKTILQKTLMNSSFSWVGATSNTLSAILMKRFGISSQAATELAEEILNVAGSYGVTKANGADYTQTDAFVDLATGLIFARIAGGGGRNVEVDNNKTNGVITPKSEKKVRSVEDSWILKYKDNPNIDKTLKAELIQRSKVLSKEEIEVQLNLLDFALENNLDINDSFFNLMTHASYAEDIEVFEIKTKLVKELLLNQKTKYIDIVEFLDSMHLKNSYGIAEIESRFILDLLNKHNIEPDRINSIVSALMGKQSSGYMAEIVVDNFDKTLKYLGNNNYKYANYTQKEFNPLKNTYTVNAYKDGKSYELCFTYEGEFVKAEQIKNSADITHNLTQAADGRSVSTTSKHFEKVLDKLVKEIKDKEGNLLYKEYYVKSKDVKNKYDIYKQFPDGRKYKIGLAEMTSSGDISIEKTLESFGGYKTQYSYIESPDKNRLVNTRILSPEGNLICENKHKFKRINENNYLSFENGKKYEIEYEKTKIVIKEENGDITELPIVKNGENGISEDLIEAIKLLPGSVLVDIKKYGLSKIEIGKCANAEYNRKNFITVSEEYSSQEDLVFTLLHELGHYKSIQTKLCNDKAIKSVYQRERTAFLSNFSNIEYKEMEYFIENTDRRNFLNQPIEEMVAEIHALIYSNNLSSNIETRGAFLQEHFPETYALVAKKIQE